MNKVYKEYTYKEVQDLDKKVDEVINNPENFYDDYIDYLINQVSKLGQSFYQSQYGDNVHFMENWSKIWNLKNG